MHYELVIAIQMYGSAHPACRWRPSHSQARRGWTVFGAFGSGRGRPGDRTRGSDLPARRRAQGGRSRRPARAPTDTRIAVGSSVRSHAPGPTVERVSEGPGKAELLASATAHISGARGSYVDVRGWRHLTIKNSSGGVDLEGGTLRIAVASDDAGLRWRWAVIVLSVVCSTGVAGRTRG